MPGVLRVWRLCDGRRGHENQSLGLVEALAELVAMDCADIPVRGAVRGTGTVLRAADAGAPHLVVGAGHATHLPLIVAARRHRARSVVLMNPSLPRVLFDLCIVPAHDGVAEGGNVLLSLGALNRIRPPAAPRDPSAALVLLGGPSRHHGWDPDAIEAQLRALAGAAPGRRWTVAGSPRTPAATLQRIASLADVQVVPFATTTPRWLPAQLARAGVVWVSEDSVSMAYEAVSSGAPTGLLEVPTRRRGRVHAAARALLDAGLATAMADWRAGREPSAPPAPLQEARRCARALLAHWPELHFSTLA